MPAAPKPTHDIGWNVVDTGTILSPVVEPTLAEKSTGHQPGEHPPPEWFNWFWDLVSRWQEYLRDFTIQQHLWTVAQLFDTGLDDVADFIGVRSPVVRKLWAALPLGASGFFRIYAVAGGAWEVTVNAQWNRSGGNANKWTQDAGGSGSLRLSLSLGNGLVVQSKPAGAGAWVDGTWEQGGASGLVGNLVLGAGLLSTFVDAQVPRIQIPRAAGVDSQRTRIAWLSSLIDIEWLTVYRAFDSGAEVLEFAFGCQYTTNGAPGVWSQSSPSAPPPALVRLSRKRLQIWARTTTAATWADDSTGWDLGAPLYQLYWATDYDNTTTFRNTLTHANITKALALLHFDGSGGAPTIDPGCAFNVASVELITAYGLPANDVVRIHFARPFATDGYFADPKLQGWTRAISPVTGGLAVASPVVYELGRTDSELDIAIQNPSGPDYVKIGSGVAFTSNFVGAIGLSAFGAH